MPEEVDAIRRTYERFNARDIDGVLALLHADVMWANGMEGGHVLGHDGVRAYWTRQWAIIDPHVVPMAITQRAAGEIVVEVHQTVRDLTGNVLSDKRVTHIFRLAHGMIRRFDISET